MRWNLIARNATELVTPPRGARHDFITFTLDQARCFLDAVKGDRLEALYVLALTTGMREGELFELQWADVNFAAARFTWSSSSRRDRHSGTSCWSASRRTRLGATSPGSARSSSCSASNRTTTGWSSPHRGQALHPSNFLQRSFHPLLARAGSRGFASTTHAAVPPRRCLASASTPGS
jgi:integrase